MRLKLKKPIIYRHGEQRYIEKFLWLPKRVGYEVRWLESATYTQIYNAYHDEWRNGRWIN